MCNALRWVGRIAMLTQESDRPIPVSEEEARREAEEVDDVRGEMAREEGIRDDVGRAEWILYRSYFSGVVYYSP